MGRRLVPHGESKIGISLANASTALCTSRRMGKDSLTRPERLSSLDANIPTMYSPTARWATRISAPLNSRVSRDLICTAYGPTLNDAEASCLLMKCSCSTERKEARLQHDEQVGDARLTKICLSAGRCKAT